MHRIRTALLAAAAIGAGIPAIASAQMPDRRPDGEQRGQRPEGEQRVQRADRAPGEQRGAAQAPQAPPQAQVQPQQPQQQPQARQSGGGDRRPPVQAQQPAGQQEQSSQAFRDRRGGGFDRPDRGFADRGRAPGPDNRPGAFGNPGGDAAQRGFAGGRDDRRQDHDQQRGYAGGYDRGGDARFAEGRGRDDRRPDLRGGNPQGRIGTDWRGDRRYDWRGYRDQHRETFRIGRYVPPRAYYNYGYRPFAIGYRLDPFFYARNYWIDDPYDYRLPPVWGSYRWVRYYNDVLLVDLASGEVVDVIRDFFW